MFIRGSGLFVVVGVCAVVVVYVVVVVLLIAVVHIVFNCGHTKANFLCWRQLRLNFWRTSLKSVYFRFDSSH